MRNNMEIDQVQDPDYDSVKIDYVGFVRGCKTYLKFW
jgi:hypothetical protein